MRNITESERVFLFFNFRVRVDIAVKTFFNVPTVGACLFFIQDGPHFRQTRLNNSLASFVLHTWHVRFCFRRARSWQGGLKDKVPFLLETKLIELGAEFSKGGPFTPYAVVDGRIVTGQNPMSSELTAQKVVEAIKASA